LILIELSGNISEILDKLTSLVKGERRDLSPKYKFELPLKLSVILDRLRRLLIKFKRDFVSVSPIFILLRLRLILKTRANLMGAYLNSSNVLRSSIVNIICY